MCKWNFWKPTTETEKCWCLHFQFNWECQLLFPILHCFAMFHCACQSFCKNCDSVWKLGAAQISTKTFVSRWGASEHGLWQTWFGIFCLFAAIFGPIWKFLRQWPNLPSGIVITSVLSNVCSIDHGAQPESAMVVAQTQVTSMSNVSMSAKSEHVIAWFWIWCDVSFTSGIHSCTFVATHFWLHA